MCAHINKIDVCLLAQHLYVCPYQQNWCVFTSRVFVCVHIVCAHINKIGAGSFLNRCSGLCLSLSRRLCVCKETVTDLWMADFTWVQSRCVHVCVCVCASKKLLLNLHVSFRWYRFSVCLSLCLCLPKHSVIDLSLQHSRSAKPSDCVCMCVCLHVMSSSWCWPWFTFITISYLREILVWFLFFGDVAQRKTLWLCVCVYVCVCVCLPVSEIVDWLLFFGDVAAAFKNSREDPA
jgi:hypothetical protein